MKPTTTALLAVLLLIISCKKENTVFQSPGSTDESKTQDMLTAINEPAANAVRIGNQVWTTRNLNVTRYRNGDRIPQVKNQAKWASLTTGAWCWYNNDSANGAVYGRLYNWYAVNDPRGLAPAGWHIPSNAEWTTLATFLGGEAVAGGKMKSTGTFDAGTGLWLAPNTDATNSSGFTALPGGYRDQNGFLNMKFLGYWWSATENNAYHAWYRYLVYNAGYIVGDYINKQDGYSVRLVRD